MPMTSTELIPLLIHELEKLLSIATAAANDARDLATHEQSKPETQYDTVGLEASYLAHGQSQRVAELKLAIKQWQGLALRAPSNKSKVDLGCLVVVVDEYENESYYLIGPSAGGIKLSNNTKSINVITRNAPLGAALFNCYVDDEISIKINTNEIFYTVVSIR
ncbi:GreA/GreB family elongation factor [Algibacillus agarilyticus]|uniref:GreA/GreB family elongation factor n=1 Tax=Algibacillus agarilyticus TaxID=2234133 RepID=UPI000DD07F24|nr:GreA/GreB family elongation factor [Algibacillus agarilyticus]